jgi:hypothetical protein
MRYRTIGSSGQALSSLRAEFIRRLPDADLPLCLQE